MKPFTRSLAGLIACSLMASAAWFRSLPAADETPPIADDEVHQTPGSTQTGLPAVADPATSGRLRLRIVVADERGEARPTFARVAVTGSDGTGYEPADNILSSWSLHRLGNRAGKGPFRYYGWFSGDTHIHLDRRNATICVASIWRKPRTFASPTSSA